MKEVILKLLLLVFLTSVLVIPRLETYDGAVPKVTGIKSEQRQKQYVGDTKVNPEETKSQQGDFLSLNSGKAKPRDNSEGNLPKQEVETNQVQGQSEAGEVPCNKGDPAAKQAPGNNGEGKVKEEKEISQGAAREGGDAAMKQVRPAADEDMEDELHSFYSTFDSIFLVCVIAAPLIICTALTFWYYFTENPANNFPEGGFELQVDMSPDSSDKAITIM